MNFSKSEYHRLWRLRNKEKVRNYTKKYNSSITGRAARQKYYDSKPFTIKLNAAKHYQKNKIKINLRAKSYRKQTNWVKNYYCKNRWLRTLYSIKDRCNNQKNNSYKNYGGRGIECFLNIDQLKFLWFQAEAYNMEKPSIDRIDNDGDYVFSNCRYIESKENTSHRKGDRLEYLNKLFNRD